MIFKATDEQVQQMAANAVNASIQVGMGFLHSGTEVAPSEIELFKRETGLGAINLDYVNGRMVKLYMREIMPGVWSVNDIIRHDYQSWCRQYPTVKMLLSSVIREGLDEAIIEYTPAERL